MSPFGHLRLGRLLEDLDAMAGNIAFKYPFDCLNAILIVVEGMQMITIHQQDHF